MSYNVALFLKMLFLYLFALFLFFIYKHFYNPIIFKTTVGINGHLNWNWVPSSKYEMLYVFLLYFSPYLYHNYYYEKNPIVFYLVMLSFILYLIYYNKSKEYGVGLSI